MTFDLQKTVSDAIAKAIDGGELEALIQKQVTEAVAQSFTEQFGWRTPFRKAIDDALKQALSFNPADFDVQRYQLLVRNMVKARIEEKMNNDLAAELNSLLKDLFDTDVPAEIKLSELVSAYIEKHEKDAYDRGGSDRVNIRVKSDDYGYTEISFHPNGGKSLSYGSEYEISLSIDKDGKVYHMSGSGLRDPKNNLILSRFDAFERLVVGLWMRKSKVILDNYDSHYKEEPEDECHC